MFRIGKGIRAFNSQHKEMDAVREILKTQLTTVDGPVHIMAEFWMPIPASASQKTRDHLDHAYCPKKPDLDNLIKFLLDVLTGIAFHGDQQVVTIAAFKKYSIAPMTVVYVVSDIGDNEHDI
jgi:Holliday junction resolvase RusA-like endonuclease